MASGKGYRDACRPISLVQQHMRMLMTPLMKCFIGVLHKKGWSCEWLYGSPSSLYTVHTWNLQRSRLVVVPICHRAMTQLLAIGL